MYSQEDMRLTLLFTGNEMNTRMLTVADNESTNMFFFQQS